MTSIWRIATVFVLAVLFRKVSRPVWGSCIEDRFGPPECLGECHCYDGPSVCDRQTGECRQGLCRKGWTGKPKCQTACSEGTFGLYCQTQCHCPEGDTCDKVNGYCASNQCEKGWSGPSCQTAMSVLSTPPEVIDISSHSVTLSWRCWSSDQDIGREPPVLYSLEMEVTDDDSQHWSQVVAVEETGQESYNVTVQGLTPATRYRFRITLACIVDTKRQMSIPGQPGPVIMTGCDVPTGHPSDLQVETFAGKTAGTVQITWRPPDQATLNCDGIMHYEAHVHCSPDCGDCIIPITWQDTSVAITGLPPAATVEVALHIVNGAGLRGPPSSTLRFHIPASHPFTAFKQGLSTEVAPRPTVAFALTSKEQICASTTVIISYEPNTELVPAAEPSPLKTKENNDEPSSTANLPMEFESASEWEQAIEQKEDSSGIKEEGSKELAITEWERFQIGMVTMENSRVPSNKKEDILTSIVAVVISGAVMLTLVMVMLLFLCWRRRHDSERYKDIMTYHRGLTLADKSSILNHSPTPSPFKEDLHQPALTMLDFTGRDIEPYFDQEAETSCSSTSKRNPIPVEELETYYKRRHQSDFPLSEEFHRLPSSLASSTHAASLPENKLANRSGEVVPYDCNRIHLELTDDDNTGYINASMVCSTNKRLYIATQLPSSRTAGAFWRMVWQRHANIIVMLMDLHEPRRPAYEKYWPESCEVTYDNIKVVTIKEDNFANVSTRCFEICQIGSDEPRLVKQFQYLSWTLTGIPILPLAFVDFVDMVHKEKHLRKNIVVHCLTGGGRSGVYIAVDSLLQEGRDTGKVDILRCVGNLQLERPHLVKTPKQYLFIFRCLIEAFSHQNTQMQSRSFCLAFSNLPTASSSNLRTVLAGTSDDLREGPEMRHAYSRSGLPTMHTLFVSPKRRQSVSLSTMASDKDISHSIADWSIKPPQVVRVSSYRHQDAFLLLESPSEDCYGDFWNIVYDRNTLCIITLDSPDHKLAPYIPQSEGEMIYGRCAVTFRGEMAVWETYARWEVAVGLAKYPSHKARPVCHFQYLAWPEEDDIPSPGHFAQFVMDILRWYKHREKKRPIVIHGGKSMSRAGVLCTLWYLMEREGCEHQVDVDAAIKIIRFYAPKAIHSLAQYFFLHEAMVAYFHRLEALHLAGNDCAVPQPM